MRGDHWAKWSLRNLTILFPITARESTVHPKNQKSKSPEQTPSSAGGPAQGGGRPTGLPHTWPRRARAAEGRETTQIKTHTKQEQTPETVCKTSPRHLALPGEPRHLWGQDTQAPAGSSCTARSYSELVNPNMFANDTGSAAHPKMKPDAGHKAAGATRTVCERGATQKANIT